MCYASSSSVTTRYREMETAASRRIERGWELGEAVGNVYTSCKFHTCAGACVIVGGVIVMFCGVNGEATAVPPQSRPCLIPECAVHRAQWMSWSIIASIWRCASSSFTAHLALPDYLGAGRPQRWIHSSCLQAYHPGGGAGVAGAEGNSRKGAWHQRITGRGSTYGSTHHRAGHDGQ